MALESGYDAAVMAPTEILAEQHHANFQKWFQPLGMVVALQTGSHKPGQRPDKLPMAMRLPTRATMAAIRSRSKGMQGMRGATGLRRCPR